VVSITGTEAAPAERLQADRRRVWVPLRRRDDGGRARIGLTRLREVVQEMALGVRQRELANAGAFRLSPANDRLVDVYSFPYHLQTTNPRTMSEVEN
jgi:hypothetical protein